MSTRRGFITLLGGAALATWPFAARAQQGTMPVIGFLHSASPDGNADRVRTFRQGLKETGFVEGENVAIEYRWADSQVERLPALATELVRRGVAVIVVFGPVVAFAAKAATTTIPIVFVVPEDPVRLGLVTNLAQQGGNLTGINFFPAEVTGKRLRTIARVGARSRSDCCARQANQPYEYQVDIERRGRGLSRDGVANEGFQSQH